MKVNKVNNIQARVQDIEYILNYYNKHNYDVICNFQGKAYERFRLINRPFSLISQEIIFDFMINKIYYGNHPDSIVKSFCGILFLLINKERSY